MKAWVYIRVSTAEQATNRESPEAQRRQAVGYTMMKGWEIADTFVEVGVNGSTPLAHRQEGARLLAAVRGGDAIIATKFDRMFRNAPDALATLEVLKEQGVGLHMIDLGGDVCGEGVGRLVLAVLSAVADNERERVHERIRDVKRHLALQNVFGGGKRPFGYDVVDGKLVPNAVEQAELADMVARRKQGESYHAIGAAHGRAAISIKRILARVEAKQL